MLKNQIIFEGFNSGETDFAALEARSIPDARARLGRLLDRIVAGILAPPGATFNSLVIVGHSDRQDTLGMSCDDRRKSEHSAALRRAASAAEWILDRIDERLVAGGHPPVPDRGDIQNMTYELVFAGAGNLESVVPPADPYSTPPPQTAADRLRNRRVVFLVSPLIP